MEDDKLEENLHNSLPDYGEKFTEHYFNQYSMYVDSANKISERRINNNKFFLSLNVALTTILGVLIQLPLLDTLPFYPIIVGILSICGIIFSIAWYKLLQSYKKINDAKYWIIIRLEKKLPLSLYTNEWRYLEMEKEKNTQNKEGSKKGITRKKIRYRPFSTIEMWIPLVFLGIYALSTIFVILYLWLCSNLGTIFF